MNKPIRYILFLFLSFSLLLTTSDCFALRCGDETVAIGDSMSDVDYKCGRPTVFTVIKTWDKNSPGTPKSTGYYSNTSDRSDLHSYSDETWIYNCGAGDFAYSFHFERNILVRESQTRGHGPNECISGHEKSRKEYIESIRLKNEKEDRDYRKRVCPPNTVDLRQLRDTHMSRARKVFPNENNMTTQFEMYRQGYLTEEERKLLPVFFGRSKDPCVPKPLHNVRTDLVELQGLVRGPVKKTQRHDPKTGLTFTSTGYDFFPDPQAVITPVPYPPPNGTIYHPIKQHDSVPDKQYEPAPEKPITEKKHEPMPEKKSDSSAWFQCKDKDGNVTISNVGCPE